MKNKLLLLIAAASISATAFAQRMPKLEIGYGEVFTVAAENTLYVDTLVLQDKATIKFAPAKQGVLEAKVAYVGKDCTISAKGADGAAGKWKSAGESGEDGGSLSVVMHFAQLGSLTLDTRGGKGGRGADGKDGRRGKRDSHQKVVSRGANGQSVSTIVHYPGTPGTNGTDATMGGGGGNGGNLMLLYSTQGFIANINRDTQVHNINILHTAGESGQPGTPGKGGYMSTDGTLILSAYKPGKNGNIQLKNLNQPQYGQSNQP